MIVTKPDHLLFIEPHQAPTAPIVDDVTRKLTAAWRERRTGLGAYKGTHSCTARDGAESDNRDHRVMGFVTHSLCIHYVACHRAEVPQGTLDLIASWTIAGVDPTDDEITGRGEGDTPGLVEAIDRQRSADQRVPSSSAMLLEDRQVGGLTWYRASIHDDSSGWCVGLPYAVKRLMDWMRGDVVGSAPDGQCSRAEMDALAEFAQQDGRSDLAGAIDAAINDGMGSDQWLAVSAEVARDNTLMQSMYGLPLSPRIRRGGF